MICPSNWVDFGTSCYKFTRSPTKNVDKAEETCQLYNAHLVSVNNLEEHLFITNWLRNNDPLHRVWHTSGRDQGNNAWRWDADRTEFTVINDLWLPIDVQSPNSWKQSNWKNAAYKYVQIDMSLNSSMM